LALSSSREDVVSRGVGDDALDRGQFLLRLLGRPLELVDLFLERLHLGQRLGRGLALAGGELVAASALLLEPSHGLAALALELRIRLEPGAGKTFGHLPDEALGVLS
jgi:hypothetical protein